MAHAVAPAGFSLSGIVLSQFPELVKLTHATSTPFCGLKHELLHRYLPFLAGQQASGLLCIPFTTSTSQTLWTQAFSDRIGLGTICIYAAFLLPLQFRLSYTSLSPNSRTFAFNSLLPILFAVVSSLVGAGTAAATLVLAVWSVGSSMLGWSKDSGIPPVPIPAERVYLSNLYAVLSIVSIFAPCIPAWVTQLSEKNAYLVSAYANPVLAFVLLGIAPLLTGSAPAPQSLLEAKRELAQYAADDVSYAFERVWGYYRKAGGLSVVLFWYGLSRVQRGYMNDHSHLSQATLFIACQAALLAFTLYGLIALDRSSFRAPPPPSPNKDAPTPAATGALADNAAVERLCQAALARAPAGWPWAELTWFGTFKASLVGGPGMAAAFFWSRGEEEDGWKSRRAWREVAAEAGVAGSAVAKNTPAKK